MADTPNIESLARRVGEKLLARHWELSTAESCTGGWIAQAATAIPGSSQWFERGFVTYSNSAKQEMLGVHPKTIDTFGPVSEYTVLEMARGALSHSHAQISVSVSGVAGPGGGTDELPVGTVWFGFAWPGGEQAKSIIFPGDREDVRRQAVEYALETLLTLADDD